MIQSIGSGNRYGLDAEYLRVMRELLAFGLPPTGNKTKDAQRLGQTKNELLQKIRENQNVSDSEQNLGVQIINPVDDSEYIQRSEMEIQRLGAVNIGELNKLFFKL